MTKLVPAIEPKSTYIGNYTDSRQWQKFKPRIGDVIVSTPPKCGTTWTQGILALLIAGDPQVNANPSFNAPWFDSAFNTTDEILERLDRQLTQRQIKTHTALDGVPIWDEIRYITVYRHPIDVHFSYKKHVANYRPESAEGMSVDMAMFPDDPQVSFHLSLADTEPDHGNLNAVINHYKTCLELEPRENILRLHYADMRRDLEGSVHMFAEHVGIFHPPHIMKTLVEAASFDNMKSNANRFSPAAGEEFWRNDAGFFDSATSNKWEGVLTEEDLTVYDAAISRQLNTEERRWLEWGDRPG